MADDQQEKLCQRCQRIDFEDLFRGFGSNAVVEAEAALALDRIPEWTNPSCPLCKFWLDMVPDEERETCSNISIFRAQLACRNGSTNKTPIEAPKMELRTTLVIKTRNSEADFERPFVNYSKAPETPVLLDYTAVDYKPLREWCRIVHEIAREAMLVLPVSVIDCHKREVVPVRGPCDYVALSYVWGPTVAQTTPGKGNSLPSPLPRTVEDAMTVVRELGLRYLWIDRYCLDQSNKAEFKAQLDQMADIYRHALVTIIGAAGSDADYGLPGVSSRVRSKQPRIKIGDYTLWSSMTDPRKLVRESTWMTRAWTHQEGVFSWNWIAFTDEQVFFQRSNKEWANVERWWKVSSEMFPHGGLGADSNCPLLQMYDNVWKNEGAVHGMLGQYTSRKLSYQTDALNGILGLLKRCENGPYRMNHYFGIPILGPLISHRKAQGRDLSRSWTLTEAFLVNLCWRAKGVGSRRLGFPSWSWAGWHAVYEAPPHIVTHLGLSIESLVDVRLFVKNANGLVDWEAMCNSTVWDVYTDFSSFSQELYVQAPTVALTIFHNTGPPIGAAYSHTADVNLPLGWCAFFSDDECDVFIEVNMVDAGIESMALNSTAVSLKGILLRQVDSKKPLDEPRKGSHTWAFALIVLEGQGGATRVGSLELRADNYLVLWKQEVQHSGAEEDKVWKEGAEDAC
ncbi:hypothetical protein AK830_g7702 [Neonectria ditissima]|uniref:Heterokaryon incompatibility domain-containing protein n=1 Tax=Neonectria ditissima TaxID=78410 RepID=A0A0P7AZ34_9HYPO|nr:hypothetical protein AK830_g7702 [Neonectria ditissima]